MKGRYLIGILLILVGAGFLMDQFGMVSFGELVSTYWPSILILAGLLGLLDRHSSTFGNLIVIALGVIFQLNRLDMLDGDIFRYIFPVILIFVGLNLLVSKGEKKEYHEYHRDTDPESEDSRKKGDWTITSEDFMDRTVLMSGVDAINSSQNFKGARLTAIMGGIELDRSKHGWRPLPDRSNSNSRRDRHYCSKTLEGGSSRYSHIGWIFKQNRCG